MGMPAWFCKNVGVKKIGAVIYLWQIIDGNV